MPGVNQLAYFGENRALDHYVDQATEVAYPTEDQCEPPRAGSLGREPRRIHDIQEDEIWDLSLDEAIRMALRNGVVIRDDGSFGSPGNPVLANPNGARTKLDIAILDSGILFGGRGVEAALADFDANVTSTMTWGRSEQIQNTPNLGLLGGDVLTQETAAWSTQLQKQMADSSTFTLQHDLNYTGTSLPTTNVIFPSSFNGFLRAEFRRPLGAGSGPEFTRIAGPIGANLTGVSGVAQGVVISRINTDIAIADFENAVAALVRDVENRYWDLHLLYQVYDAEKITAQDTILYWQAARERADSDSEIEYQAAAAYHEAQSRIENSLADILENEARLRRLLGLVSRDHRIIRPSDSPSDAALIPDWTSTVAEAFSRRPEIRGQKWNIKSLKMQLKAARSLVRPRFDVVAQYQVNQFGDQLFGHGDASGVPNFVNDSFYESLTQGLTTTWNAGFQLAMPLGLRTAQSQVRNYELRVRKAQALLRAQESEIVYELDAAVHAMDRWYTNARTNKARLEAARKQLEAAQEKLNEEGSSLQQINGVSRAHSAVREAWTAYYRSLVEYNKGITELNYRKGALLVANNIHLAEGLWCPSAYNDALRRAWSRTYAKDSTKLRSAPVPFKQAVPPAMPQAGQRPPVVPEAVPPTPSDIERSGDPATEPGQESPRAPAVETVRNNGWAKPGSTRQQQRLPQRAPGTHHSGARKRMPTAQRDRRGGGQKANSHSPVRGHTGRLR